MSYIMGIQLVNGTDLIGSITGLDDHTDFITIEDPAQVAMMPSQGGAPNSMSIGLLPRIFGSGIQIASSFK